MQIRSIESGGNLMKKGIIYFIILFMIITLTGCKWRNIKEDVKPTETISKPENSQEIKQEDQNEKQDEKKDETVINNNPIGQSENSGNSVDNDKNEETTGPVEISEDLEIEVGEDQEIGGL